MLYCFESCTEILILHSFSFCWTEEHSFINLQLFVWNQHSTQPVLKYSEHTAAVKAIAWSPHLHGLLASGGGTADRCIRFWNTTTNSHLSCMDTGSQVKLLFNLFFQLYGCSIHPFFYSWLFHGMVWYQIKICCLVIWHGSLMVLRIMDLVILHGSPLNELKFKKSIPYLTIYAKKSNKKSYLLCHTVQNSI